MIAPDHLLARAPGELGHAFVHVSVAPVVIDRREGVADRSQHGLALLDQVAHFVLPAARAQGHADHAHERVSAHRALDQSHVHIRSQKLEGALAGIAHRAGMRQQNNRQIGPGRLLREFFAEARQVGLHQRFFSQQDGAGIFPHALGELAQAPADFDFVAGLPQDARGQLGVPPHGSENEHRRACVFSRLHLRSARPFSAEDARAAAPR